MLDSQGSIVTVSDEEILEAQRLLASEEGIFAEPAGTASLAGIRRFSKDQGFDRDDTVVSLATGAGLKDMTVLLKEGLVVPEIGPTFGELANVLAD